MGALRSRVRTAAIVSGVAVVGFAGMLQFKIGGARFALVDGDDVLQTLAPLIAAITCGLAARRATGRGNRAAWALLGLSALSWALGQVMWTWYEVGRGVDTPFPSWADAGYLLAQPLAMAGMLAFPSAADTSPGRIRVLVDGMIVAGSLLFVGWAFVLGPTLANGTGSFFAQAIGLAYPAGDVAVLTVVAIALSRVERRFQIPVALVGLALAALAVSDSFFAYLALNGSYNGGLVDTGWFAGYVCLSLAAVVAMHGRRVSVDSRRGPSRLELPSKLIAYVPLLAVIGIGMARTIANRPISGVLLADGLVLALLMLLRHVLMILENSALQRSLEATVAELQERERHFRSLVQRSSDVVAVVDSDLRVTYVSPSVQGVLGYPAAGVVGATVETFVHPDDVDAVLAELERVRAHPIAVGRVEARWRHQREGWRHCETTFTDLRDDSAVRGFVLNTRDVTERKQAELELAHRVRHDALTGLPTRAPIVELLTRLLPHATAETPVAALFVDLDRFKVINDSLGHDIGDDVLTVVARRFQSAIGRDGVIGRFGGDEFVAVVSSLVAETDGLDPVDEGGAPHTVDTEEVASRLLRALRRPMSVGGRDVFLSCSIGVVVSTTTATTPDALIRDADVAMYAAKEKGRNRVESFRAELRRPTVAQLDVEADLHRGTERGEFVLMYQPVFDLSSGMVTGYEALLRWRHPSRGLLLPEVFLHAAEETGLIVPIGEWVLRTACEEIGALRASGRRAALLVNVSARQLAEPNILCTIDEAVRQAGIDVSAVCIEVTEGVIVDSAESVATLRALEDRGFRLAVDDFGTGYASLTHLRRLPFSALKIDKSFVAGLGCDESSAPIVAAITHMATALGLRVVAEGVEGHDQLAALQALGCEYGQGFLLSPPVEAGRLREIYDDAASRVAALLDHR